MLTRPFRATVRGLAERTLLLGAAIGRRAGAVGRDAIVLAYHDVLPPGAVPAGDRSLHLRFDDFVAQLDLLEESHEIVPLAELLAEGGKERIRASRRPHAAITFDDAYRGAVTVAAAELVRRRLPATIFVAPAFLGGRAFWWDELGTAPGLDEAVREEAVGALRGESGRILAWAAARGVPSRTPAHHERCASEEELRGAVGRGRGAISLGSHSWSHPNLSSLGGEALRRELVLPLEWLRSRFDGVLPVISYPYGRYSDDVEREARAAGYAAGLAASGGPVGSGPHGFTLPRSTIPAGVSQEGFRLRTLGVVRR